LPISPALQNQARALHIAFEAQLEHDAQTALGFLRRANHRVCLFQADCHRFLDQHMLARLQRGNRDRRVQVMGQAQANHMDVVALENVLVFAAPDGDFVAARERAGAVFVDVRDANQVRFSAQHLIGFRVRRRNSACPDNPDAYRLHALAPGQAQSSGTRTMHVLYPLAQGESKTAGIGAARANYASDGG
jgi:hypothetical protein